MNNAPTQTPKPTESAKSTDKNTKSVDGDLVPRAKKINDKDAKEVLGGLKKNGGAL